MSGKPAYDLYKEAIEQFGAALERLARAYEADPEKRRDLLQDSMLLLVPYGLLLTLSVSIYTVRRRIELPGIEREIRDLGEFRKWNPAA